MAHCYYRETENIFNICSCSLQIYTVLNCAFYTLHAAFITWNLFIHFYTTKLYIKSEICVGNSRVVKIYIIRPKPGPVAKNATPSPSGWESNPRPLDYQISALPLSYRSRCRQLGREFSICINEIVMPVKYKGILIIIFGIYTRCQQMKVGYQCYTYLRLSSIDNECKCQIL